MIIWINGAFGSGKTNTAYELQRRIPQAFVYDPEEMGFFLRSNLPKGLKEGDFQDFPLWCGFNYQMLRYMEERYQGIIIVPMTVVNEAYFNELIGQIKKDGFDIKHFTLMADGKTLLKRLRKRGDGKNSWAAKQIDRCIHHLNRPLFAEHIKTDDMSLQQVVEHIAEKCAIQLLKDERNWLIRKKDRVLIWLRHIRWIK